MTPQRLVLLMLSVVVSAATTVDAAQITTSARVQIVSGVEVERVVPSLETTLETTIAPSGAVAFHIVGPTDQAMNVAWTSPDFSGTSAPDSSPAAISRDGGALLVWLEQGATDGHLLIEYE